MIGRVATLDSSRVTWPLKPGSTKPAVAWVSRPSRPEAGLALDAGREVVGQGHRLEGAAEHELARVQHEALGGVDLDEAGEVGLVLRRGR